MTPKAMDDRTNQDEHEVRKTRGKRRKVGKESGLTEEDRRVIRKEQRDLSNLIDGAVQSGNQFETIQTARERNNQLFERVAFTREAVLDGENMEMIAAKYAKQVDQLIQVPRYDAVRLVKKLKHKCMTESMGQSTFDWKSLGGEAGVCFNAIPSRISFFAGPLDDGSEPKVRKVRQPRRQRVEEQVEEVEPEETRKQVKTADQLSAAERTLKVVKEKLKERCKETVAANKSKIDTLRDDDPKKAEAVKEYKKHGSDIEAFQFLCNPTSFTQTVENFFHFAFLIKKGDAGIRLRKEEGGLYLRSISKATDQSYTCAPRQAIVSMDMKDWRKLCESFEVEKGDIPNRTGSKIKKNTPTRT